MRYVQIRKAVTIMLAPERTETDQNTKAVRVIPAITVEYSLPKMLDELVWTSPTCRSDATGVVERCADPIADGPEDADWVFEVSDADHEFVSKLLQAAPNFAPHMARPLNRIARSWILAPSTPPEGFRS